MVCSIINISNLLLNVNDVSGNIARCITEISIFLYRYTMKRENMTQMINIDSDKNELQVVLQELAVRFGIGQNDYKKFGDCFCTQTYLSYWTLLTDFFNFKEIDPTFFTPPICKCRLIQDDNKYTPHFLCHICIDNGLSIDESTYIDNSNDPYFEFFNHLMQQKNEERHMIIMLSFYPLL